jgi:hypothetical protein
MALTLCSEYLQPDIFEFHVRKRDPLTDPSKGSILPTLFAVMADASPSVQKRASQALEVFCDNMGEDIISFLEPLMVRLLALLAAPQSSAKVPPPMIL